MICEKCGKKIADGVTACDGCGNPIKLEAAGDFSINIVASSKPELPPKQSTPPPVIQAVRMPAPRSKGPGAGLLAIAVVVSLVLGWLANSLIVGDGSESKYVKTNEDTSDSSGQPVDSNKNRDPHKPEFEPTGEDFEAMEEYGEIVADGQQYFLLAGEFDKETIITIYDIDTKKAVLDSVPLSEFEFSQMFSLDTELSRDSGGAEIEADNEAQAKSPVASVDHETIAHILESKSVYLGEGVFAISERELTDDAGWYDTKGGMVFVISFDERSEKTEITFENTKYISSFENGHMLAFDKYDNEICYSFNKTDSISEIKVTNRPDLEKEKFGNYIFIDGVLRDSKTFLSSDADVKYETDEDGNIIAIFSPKNDESENDTSSKDITEQDIEEMRKENSINPMSPPDEDNIFGKNDKSSGR